MIIDTHIHLPKGGGEKDTRQILVDAAKNGINLLVVSDLGDWSDYPEKAIITKANNRAKRFAAYDKKRILWQAYLNPQLDNWKNELKRCAMAGAGGVKLWISLKDDNGNLDNTVEVLKAAAKFGFPVLLHTFSRADTNRGGEISIQEFVKLSEIVPECVMIAAHAGGNWRYSMGMIRDSRPGVYMDISGGYPEQGMVDGLVKSNGADRIVFGSDAMGRSFHSQVSKVIFSKISIEAKDKILWKNAAEIYRIHTIPPLPAVKKYPKLNVRKSLDFSEDHFCFTGVCPFFRSSCEKPEKLEKLLLAEKIKKAFVGDLSSIFYLDLLASNRKFLKACKNLNIIKPLATFNPIAYNWRYQVEDVIKNSYAGGIIFPYLHNWQLNAPEFSDFFNYCSEYKVKLWINCAVADYRFRHKVFNLRNVASDELLSFMENAPKNNYVFQGVESAAQKKLLKIFNDDKQFYFDISRLTDGQLPLREILEEFGAKRLVAGSEFPFRYVSQVKQTALKL